MEELIYTHTVSEMCTKASVLCLNDEITKDKV